MENKALVKKRLRDELTRGRDSTKTLQNLLRLKVCDVGSVAVDNLVMTITGSFDAGLSELGYCDSGEFCRIPASSQEGLPLGCSDDRTSGKSPAPVVKDRRGSYKRRKTADSRVNIGNTIEDGYAWRKYGQKKINSAKFPRCYYRCTLQKSHGCKALKQVQKLEDGSNMFHIMYIGHHTCQNKKNTITTINANAPTVLNFEDSKNLHNLPNSPSTFTSVHVTPSLKQEYDFKAQSDNVSSVQIGDYEPGHEGAPNMGFDFDHEGSCASMSSSSYLDNYIFNEIGVMSDFHFDDDNIFLSVN